MLEMNDLQRHADSYKDLAERTPSEIREAMKMFALAFPPLKELCHGRLVFFDPKEYRLIAFFASYIT